MSNYMNLIGAEQVQNAGQAMRSAADEMRSAASTISSAFDEHQRFLEDWLYRFSAVLEGNKGTPT